MFSGNSFYGDNFRWFVGRVVDNLDPDLLGRVQVHINGIHSESQADIPQSALPWAQVLMPGTEGGTSGIGKIPQLQPGAFVFGLFMDGKTSQLPLVLGHLNQFEIPTLTQEFQAQRQGVTIPPGTTAPNSPVDANYTAPGYPPDLKSDDIKRIIRREARLRNIDPDIAVRIYEAEGLTAYQSKVRRSGEGTAGGREASYGPYQLFTGGGLGTEYQNATGRDLRLDNTEAGITKQIQFALDKAVSLGWTPWYGRKPAGVGPREGLEGARVRGNWK